MEQTPDVGIQISWLGTFCRLLVVLLFIGFFSWGAWKLSQPANIWTSNSEIKKTESDVRGIHQEAEKARKEMQAPRAFSVESLVYHALNDGYELTEEERLFVQSNWATFVQNSNITDDQNILFRLRMRRAEDGSIEDYPLEEWREKNEERKRAAEEKEHEEQMHQAMMQGAQEVVQQSGKAEEMRVKTEDQKKRAASERRSNREIVRNVVEEAKENFYAGKPLEGVEPEEAPEVGEPEAEEPGAEEPGAEEPGAEVPGAEEPGAEVPGAEEPGAEVPGAENPEAEDPEAEDLGVEVPGAEEPAPTHFIEETRVY